MIIPTFELMINPAPCKHAYNNNEAEVFKSVNANDWVYIITGSSVYYWTIN